MYYANPGQPAFVLRIDWQRQHHFTQVLLALFQDAWEQGASAVKGPAIPQFLTTLTEQHCLFRQPYSCVVGHARDPEIINAFRSGDASLSAARCRGVASVFVRGLDLIHFGTVVLRNRRSGHLLRFPETQ